MQFLADPDSVILGTNYTLRQLEQMSLDELIAAQRAILLPHEQEKFDQGEPIYLEAGDYRADFLDATDAVIGDKSA